MPELLAASPPREQLLRHLRLQLPNVVPGCQLLAVEMLGADATIDFVAAEPGGGVVLLLVGGEGEDLELIGRALAQRAWVDARLRDWLQLAPQLGLRPEAGARVVLLCPSFRPESRAAAQAVGAGVVDLVEYRCVRNGAGVEALLERVPAAARRPASAPAAPPPALRSAHVAAPSAVEPAPFRTGLSEAELGLTAEERQEFE